jgi:hypothetical protein
MKNITKTFYKCDPEKNTQCAKSTCMHNPNAEFKACDRTSHIEYSIDGVPLEDNEFSDQRMTVERPSFPKRHPYIPLVISIIALIVAVLRCVGYL